MLFSVFFADYDTITLTPDIVITNQSIGNVVVNTANWLGVDGILGVGPVGLTIGSLSPNITSLVPTVMDNARKQGLIQQQIMSVSFAPASSDNDTSEDSQSFSSLSILRSFLDGIITFGGVDPSLVSWNSFYSTSFHT